MIGLSSNRQGSIYFTASIVIILALFRLFLEMYQMISQGLRYLLDWVNWMEWFLFVCTVIFASVFHADCLCVRDWQWQIGIVAVFLGWIELMFFLSKLPLIGIYVVMFLEILKTVLKIIIFSFLLLVAFGLAFYMAFFEPNITVKNLTSFIIKFSSFCCTAFSFLKCASFTPQDHDHEYWRARL